MVKELEAKTKFLSEQNPRKYHVTMIQPVPPQDNHSHHKNTSSSSTSTTWSIQQMHQSYLRSMNETRCLRKENANLKEKLIEFDAFAEQAKRFLQDFEIPPSSFSSSVKTTTAIADDIFFEPISEEVSCAILRQSYEEAMHFFTTTSTTTTTTTTTTTDHDQNHIILGWKEHRRRVNATSIQFSFSKTLGKQIGVEELMQKSWQMYSDLSLYRGIYAFVQKLDVLQRINEDTLVIRRDIQRDIHSPIFRTILLLFRIRTETGYVICFRSHNPTKVHVEEEKKKNIQWMDCFYWLILSNQDGDFQPNSLHGCDVKFGGTLFINDQTMKYHANFWTLEIMMALLRWESNAIGGFIQVT
jgi:hypothetical protein